MELMHFEVQSQMDFSALAHLMVQQTLVLETLEVIFVVSKIQYFIFYSEGGLICHGQIAGIVSFGFGCARINFPGAYVDVAAYNRKIV